MGNTQGGESKNPTGQTLVDILNDRSRQGNSHSADTVTLQGMNMYLNEKAGVYSTWNPSHAFERVNRYLEIQGLAKQIGMSDEAGDKLMAQAYKSLNGRNDALAEAKIADPATIRSTQTIPNTNTAPNTNSGPSHPEELRRQAVTLAVNPHSYSSLSGMDTQKLLALDTDSLRVVVHADNSFVEKTQGHWNLPVGQQQATALNVKTNYNADLCHSLGLAGQTNATPTEAFVNGKDTLLKAVSQGFDVYGQHTGQAPDDKALKAFGQVAMSVNLATNVSNTLTGRGADTISENTMMYSPDGHSNATKKGGY